MARFKALAFKTNDSMRRTQFDEESIFALSAVLPGSVCCDHSRSRPTDKADTVNGWISDSKCGVKGANAGAAACTKKCLEEGAKMVVVTDGDQKILNVENPDALKGHEGHHVAVSGKVTGDTIHVKA